MGQRAGGCRAGTREGRGPAKGTSVHRVVRAVGQISPELDSFKQLIRVLTRLWRRGIRRARGSSRAVSVAWAAASVGCRLLRAGRGPGRADGTAGIPSLPPEDSNLGFLPSGSFQRADHSVAAGGLPRADVTLGDLHSQVGTSCHVLSILFVTRWGHCGPPQSGSLGK